LCIDQYSNKNIYSVYYKMKGDKSKCLQNAVLMGIILNIVLPYLLKPFASQEEIKPPNGIKSLSLKGQIMHMLIHHHMVPVSSSVIIALIVGLSVYLGYNYPILK